MCRIFSLAPRRGKSIRSIKTSSTGETSLNTTNHPAARRRLPRGASPRARAFGALDSPGLSCQPSRPIRPTRSRHRGPAPRVAGTSVPGGLINRRTGCNPRTRYQSMMPPPHLGGHASPSAGIIHRNRAKSNTGRPQARGWRPEAGDRRLKPMERRGRRGDGEGRGEQRMEFCLTEKRLLFFSAFSPLSLRALR